MPTLFVVMPVFNESATVATSVRRAREAPLPDGWSAQVILVDDGSELPTVDRNREVAHRGEATVIFLARNRGKGAALRTGFGHALERASERDAVVIQDADLEYDSRDFASLLEPVIRGEADLVLGNRWTGSATSTLRLAHRLLNGFLTWASNLTTGLRVQDMECCLKLFSVPALRRVLPDLDEDRFGIEPQIVASAARHGLRVRETPVSYDPRGFADGKKIRAKDGLQVFAVLWRERRRTRAAQPGAR